MIELLRRHFERQGWRITREDDGRIIASMDSGYGSGPAIVDLTEIVQLIKEFIVRS